MKFDYKSIRIIKRLNQGLKELKDKNNLKPKLLFTVYFINFCLIPCLAI